MRQKELIDLFISITEKADNLRFDDSSQLEADVLHASLSIALKDFTEEEYNKFPIYLRKTIEKVERKILKHVSCEYKNDYEQEVKENGKFRTQKSRLVGKCKQRIGFYETDKNTNKVD